MKEDFSNILILHPYRSEFPLSLLIVTHPNFPSYRYNLNPNLRHGCFSREFRVKLSSGSKNPAHLAGKRIGRDLRGLKKPCFTGADGN
jgi:hypothetical protein